MGRKHLWFLAYVEGPRVNALWIRSAEWISWFKTFFFAASVRFLLIHTLLIDWFNMFWKKWRSSPLSGKLAILGWPWDGHMDMSYFSFWGVATVREVSSVDREGHTSDINYCKLSMAPHNSPPKLSSHFPTLSPHQTSIADQDIQRQGSETEELLKPYVTAPPVSWNIVWKCFIDLLLLRMCGATNTTAGRLRNAIAVNESIQVTSVRFCNSSFLKAIRIMKSLPAPL